jgi:hypothetical protein
MAARLTLVVERIKVEARRMILARPVDNLSGLAALLSVWPQLKQVAGSARDGLHASRKFQSLQNGPATLGQSEQFGTSNGARRWLQFGARCLIRFASEQLRRITAICAQLILRFPLSRDPGCTFPENRCR